MKSLKYFNCTLLIIGLYTIFSVNNTFAQGKPKHLKRVHKIVHSLNYKDSITLQPGAELADVPIAYKNNKTTYAKVVKFTLKITNGCAGAIPDPIAYKGSKFVKLYVNGKLNNPKVLFDETEDATDTDKLILTGQSQTFYCDWLLSTKSKLQRKFGKRFYIQFSYIKKRSPKVWVNLNTLGTKS